ncbi:MmyB family transcriptional regulator [Jiangella rhizosphaerae]|uniref:MmyB family transcriptional regulator n=1 Tax=Jiangella rhizosphaerae TaxID=2293569 RepID=UPI001314AC6A
MAGRVVPRLEPEEVRGRAVTSCAHLGHADVSATPERPHSLGAHLLVQSLLNPDWRALIVDWEDDTPRLVAGFHAAWADHVGEPAWRSLAKRLVIIQGKRCSDASFPGWS